MVKLGPDVADRLGAIHCCCLLTFIICGAKLLNADWLRQMAFFLNHEGTFGNQQGMITWCWLVISCLATKCYYRWILRIKFSLHLLVSYACFDICGGIDRASSRGHRARMQFPQKCCPLCDKQVIAWALGQLRINFTCIFKVFPKLPSILGKNTHEINP